MLSVVLLSYFSGNRILDVFGKLSEVLGNAQISFELIIIDDGSTDNSFQIAKSLASQNSNVNAFQLSKNYTSHYAIFAGLSVCKGDCATVIPDDEQQPYDTLIKMYRLWETGNEIVIPYRKSRNDNFFGKQFSNLFYVLMNSLSEIKYPIGGADTFLIDREIIDIINEKIHPINTTSITEILRLGYSPVFIPYERQKGINQKSRWSTKKKFKLALDTFISSSSFPIKIISFLGLTISVFSFLVILFYLYINLIGNKTFWGYTPPGWISTVIFISFFSGLILFSLGIIAEYIWRIYEEVKNRPGYIIKNMKSQ